VKKFIKRESFEDYGKEIDYYYWGDKKIKGDEFYNEVSKD